MKAGDVSVVKDYEGLEWYVDRFKNRVLFGLEEDGILVSEGGKSSWDHVGRNREFTIRK